MTDNDATKIFAILFIGAAILLVMFYDPDKNVTAADKQAAIEQQQGLRQSMYRSMLND